MKIKQRILFGVVLILLMSLCAFGLVACDEDNGSTKDAVSDPANDKTADNTAEACTHVWSEWTAVSAPSCTAAGTRTRTCTSCNKTENESVDALSHSFSQYTADNNATCQLNMTATATCDRCTAKDTREVADSKATDAHTTTDVRYQKNKTDASKHDKLHTCCGAWIETQEHTWDQGTADGTVTVYACTLCEATNRVPQVGHIHATAYVAAKAASCTANGNVAYWYCEGCNTYFANEALTQQLQETERVIPATHTSTEFTYTVNATDDTKHDKKHACCGAVVETVAHSFSFYRNLLAGCEQQGGKEHKCTCGKTKLENATPASGHNVEIWNFVSETKKSGTACTYEQVYQGVCFTCNNSQTKRMESEKHHFVATVSAHPTCQSAGSKSYACTCGATPAVETVAIPATPAAHNWDAGTTQGGVTTYTCQTCRAEKTALVYTEPTQSVNTSDLANNELVLGGVSLRLDSHTLSLLDDASSVSVSAVPVTNRDAVIASIPERLRGQITAVTPIYDFALSQNETPITQFGNGVITITIPYQLPLGADADCVAVWYVADNGTVSFYEATYYEDGVNGFLTFEVSHFSTYLPAIAPSEDACELYTHNNNVTVVAPTCTEAGYTLNHCQRCGNSRMTDTVAPLGHAYDAGTSTPSTCIAPGTITYTCTVQGCNHQMSTMLYTPHTYVYDSEASHPATCLEDGYIIYTCTANGCGAQKREEETAYGSHQMENYGVALATASTKCTDGVVITKRCYICFETKTETVYEHVPYGKYGYGEDGYQMPGQTTIGLGSYLTEKEISYTEEPSIILTHACLCGEQKSEIFMTNGMGSYGELFMGGMQGFSSHGGPQTPLDCRSVVVETQPEMVGYDPATGPIFSLPFKVQFREILTIDGCHYVYSVEIKIGYDSDTGSALRTETYVLAEYDSHSIQKTATIADPSKSCYESCFDENNQFCYGITVTETCKNCQTVIRTYTASVTSDSSHYWYDTETYNYRDSNCSATDYGVRVFIKTCPCGKRDYTLYTSDCSFTSQTVGDLTVYTCSDCGYIYAQKTVTLEDRENCRYTVTKYLYLGCESISNLTTCEKTLICVLRDEVSHYSTTTVTNRDNPDATDMPCCYSMYSNIECSVCHAVIRSYEGYLMNHDLAETTTTDSHGNVTVTESCKVNGCGYLHITVKDKDGNTLREYTVEKDYGRGERSVVLYTWKMAFGALRPMLDRSEYYDLETGEILRWYQTTYTYKSEPGKGCFSSMTTINHLGEGSQGGGDLICTFGDMEHRDRTCIQDGYDKYTCTTCGHVEYTWYEEAYHYWDYCWADSTEGPQYSYCRCSMCGIIVTSECPLTIMPMYDGDDMTIRYLLEEGSTTASFNATYTFVVYTTTLDGYLVADKDTQELVTVTLSGISVTDDGAGTLSFSMEAVQDAMENVEKDAEYQYTVCLVIESSTQGTIYLPIA